MLVAGDQVCARFQGGEQGFAFGQFAGFPATSISRMSTGDEPQRPARGRGALHIVPGQGGFGRAAELAEGEDGDAQGRVTRPLRGETRASSSLSRGGASIPAAPMGERTDQIFSI